MSHDGMHKTLDAAIELVTPGQQAPLGATLSLARRLELIKWAGSRGGWIIEDDYLGELQLHRRAALAFASIERSGRVIHMGSLRKKPAPRAHIKKKAMHAWPFLQRNTFIDGRN